jgi:predicted Zn finger-like uncharacterized protein
MLIACAPCATSYFVEPTSPQRNGRRVRCSSVWRNESSRAARAAETLAPDALVPEALVVQWPPNSRAAPAQSPEVPAEVAAVNEAPGELKPAEAAAAIEFYAPPIVPVDRDRPPIDVDAEPAWRETVAHHKDIETDAARRVGCGAKQRQHVWRLSRQQSPIILTPIMLDSVVVGWRKDIVRQLPPTASFYATVDPPVNPCGLACDGASTRAERHKGVPSRPCRPTSSTKPGG